MTFLRKILRNLCESELSSVFLKEWPSGKFIPNVTQKLVLGFGSDEKLDF
jgi:hypothetical protein